MSTDSLFDRRISRRSFVGQGTKVVLAGAALGALGRSLWPAQAQAGTVTGSGPPFDFSDAFYLANGIDPANILNRVNGMDGNSVIDNHVPGPDFRNIRITNTTGGADNNGSLLYYVITGFVMPNTFTSDAAGQAALATAEKSRAFIFPKASGGPLDPSPGNRRQDNVFDYVYDPRNPLGLWTATFVSYTPAAFNTAAGQQALANVGEKNGHDLDGTPLLFSTSDITGLQQDGYVQLQHRAFDGSQGFPWIILPIIHDPRGGSIAKDAFLTDVDKPDGTPLVPLVSEQFGCLQQTGNYCPGLGLALPGTG
jgi:hypothetical protein